MKHIECSCLKISPIKIFSLFQRQSKKGRVNLKLKLFLIKKYGMAMDWIGAEAYVVQ